MPVLPRFLVYYGALFAAFGVASPFLPALLAEDGLGSVQLGLVLAAGTAIRLVAGPLGGRLSDRSGRAPLVLAGLTAAAALVALGYVPARGLAVLLGIVVLHAAVLAPLTPVADALALGSANTGSANMGSAGRGAFGYGTVRGVGSAAFIAGALLSGQMVAAAGLGVIVWLNAGLLAVAAVAALLLPNQVAGTVAPAGPGGVRALLAIPVFVRLMAVAALVGGSHALHDGFAVIRWRAAGLSDQRSSVAWALSVAAEVLVFVAVGPWLLARLGPARAMAVSAVAGAVRWVTAACTAWFPAVVLTEPLHGLTFALLHLACMDVIRRTVPGDLAATAQAFYATVAMGVAGAVVTLASGPLYARLGAGSFWFMAALCVLALPVAAGLPRAAR